MILQKYGYLSNYNNSKRGRRLRCTFLPDLTLFITSNFCCSIHIVSHLWIAQCPLLWNNTSYMIIIINSLEPSKYIRNMLRQLGEIKLVNYQYDHWIQCCGELTVIIIIGKAYDSFMMTVYMQLKQTQHENRISTNRTWMYTKHTMFHQALKFNGHKLMKSVKDNIRGSLLGPSNIVFVIMANVP
jgi:hypothetical protein